VSCFLHFPEEVNLSVAQDFFELYNKFESEGGWGQRHVMTISAHLSELEVKKFSPGGRDIIRNMFGTFAHLRVSQHRLFAKDNQKQLISRVMGSDHHLKMLRIRDSVLVTDDSIRVLLEMIAAVYSAESSSADLRQCMAMCAIALLRESMLQQQEVRCLIREKFSYFIKEYVQNPFDLDLSHSQSMRTSWRHDMGSTLVWLLKGQGDAAAEQAEQDVRQIIDSEFDKGIDLKSQFNLSHLCVSALGPQDTPQHQRLASFFWDHLPEALKISSEEEKKTLAKTLPKYRYHFKDILTQSNVVPIGQCISEFGANFGDRLKVLNDLLGLINRPGFFDVANIQSKVSVSADLIRCTCTLMTRRLIHLKE
jgi:hypothetical protein